MMPVSPPPPYRGSWLDLPVGEEPWLALWRALWLDLPLVWADEMDRFLFRPMEPLAGAATPPPASGDEAAPDQPDQPETPAMAVALGLGCGDYADEALG
ncbi:hypothetical protein ACRAWG_06735 [Methylobacterium sp. P31]